MKVGDLIEFNDKHPLVGHLNHGYVNPGLVISKECRYLEGNDKYRIMWADQKITVEHVCYLKTMETR